MLRALPLVLSAVRAPPAFAQPIPPPPGAPVVLEATLSGQPIRAAQGDLRVTINQTVLPAGGKLAAHKHPYPRLVQVLAGRIRITNLDTGAVRDAKAGDWLIDAVDQWHEAVVIGDEPARLMTIDQAPPGASVTIPRNP